MEYKLNQVVKITKPWSGSPFKKGDFAVVRGVFQTDSDCSVMYVLESISNDYMIAYYCKAFGPMKGSAKAYENKFHWGRAKTIREIKLPYEASVYLQKAELTSRLDAQVKFGEISHEKVLDYFFCIIL